MTLVKYFLCHVNNNDICQYISTISTYAYSNNL